MPADRASAGPALAVAGDAGARAAVAPLARHFRAEFLADTGSGPGNVAEWRARLASPRCPLLICGTSSTAAAWDAEALARRTARDLAVPLLCVEDFPGNYRHVPGGMPDLLVVEGGFSTRLYADRGDPPPPMIAIPPLRYDPLRGIRRRADDPGAVPVLLWAGQPEPDHCLATLRWLADALGGRPCRLLFRAHPGDPARATGFYSAVLAAIDPDWQDAGGIPLADALRREIHLVVTQFSSVAVEAGFLGIPALFVLLPEAGGGSLLRLKGYPLPSLCAEGAAFAVTSPRGGGELHKALFDVGARAAVRARFARCYATDAPVLPLVARRLERIMAGRAANPEQSANP